MPTPSQILEELAENAAIQIDRNAPVAFRTALDEMSRYHQFLLQLNAATNSDGQSFSFSEISGDFWRKPHEEWIGHYRRLFERAANRIPEDSYFIRSLAYAPHKLLPGQNDLPISNEVAKGIIDLGPLMMHMIENWVSKQAEVREKLSEDHTETRVMAGSTIDAYSGFLPQAIGAWEALLERAPIVYRWKAAKKSDTVIQWTAFQDSWPFLWQHLLNTSHCLCIAAWNEDEIATKFYSEALIGWKRKLQFDLNYETGEDPTQLPFPDIMSLNWSDAKSQCMSLRSGWRQKLEAPTPLGVLSLVVQGAFDDVLHLTSAVLLSWTSFQKQSSGIGARTASALLLRQNGEQQVAPMPSIFKELFLQFTRLKLAGASWENNSYGVTLDRFIASLDRMTERVVVPGRVYTPSTLDSRDELVSIFVAILAAHFPGSGDDGLQHHIARLSKEPNLLRKGENSISSILAQLSSIQSILVNRSEELVLATRGINPTTDADASLTQLLKVVEEAKMTIKEDQGQRLSDAPIDQVKIQKIETAMQDVLQDGDGYDLFFRDFVVQLHAEETDHKDQIFSFPNISKATLASPLFAPTISNLENSLASSFKQFAENCVLREFYQQPRTLRNTEFNVTEEAFWNSIMPLLDDVGSDPVILVNISDREKIFDQLINVPSDKLPRLDVNIDNINHPNPEYLATIEGIDVYSATFTDGKTWLFSAQKLKAVRYSELGDNGKFVDVKFVLADDNHGSLEARCLQQVEWSNGEIFEIAPSIPGGGGRETQG